jgi:hypothetical protein
MPNVLDEKRGQLLHVLTRIAEKKTIVTTVEGRVVKFGKVSWQVIAESRASYVERNHVMLSAKPAKGAATLEHLDVALASDFGRGTVKPQTRGAKVRLRDLLIVADAMRGLGDGLRFGEILAVTNLPESRLAYVLRWAERQSVFESAGDMGWFFAGQGWRRSTKNAQKRRKDGGDGNHSLPCSAKKPRR